MIVYELQQKYPLRILLPISELKCFTYYYNLSRINKDMKNDEIMRQIIDIFYTHKKRYRYRRVTLDLVNRGYKVNHRKVMRLMTVIRLYGITPRTKRKSFKGDMNGTVKNQLLIKMIDKKTYYERNSQTTRCNDKSPTDVSEFNITTGKFYLSPIINLHNRKIISVNILKSPNFEQMKNMLHQKNLNGLILQSDQGGNIK